MSSIVRHEKQDIFYIENDEKRKAIVTFVDGIFHGCKHTLSDNYDLIDWAFLRDIGNIVLGKQKLSNKERNVICL